MQDNVPYYDLPEQNMCWSRKSSRLKKNVMQSRELLAIHFTQDDLKVRKRV